MFYLLASLISGSLLVQAENIIYTKFVDQANFWQTVAPLALWTLPLQFMITFAYGYYFSSGAGSSINYVYLLLIAQATSLTVGLLLNFFYLGGAVPKPIEIFGCLLIVAGMFCVMSEKS